jgi:hypothetical protein
VRTPAHTQLCIDLKEEFEGQKRQFDEDGKQFFKLFKESTFEGSQAAARKMSKIANRATINNRIFLFFHSFYFLVGSDSKMLSWPNSPLLVLLQFVNPNVLSWAGDDYLPLQEGQGRVTPLHLLAELADPSDYSTHVNQLILAKQLIEHGANVNAVSIPKGERPSHHACYGDNVTNLDFIELLLKAGADPNAQDHMDRTPLMSTTSDAPGAAKFLLNWPTTDVNITTRSGVSFLTFFRLIIKNCSDQIALPDNPNQVQFQFLLRQWREIEEMLVGRSADDTGITAL